MQRGLGGFRRLRLENSADLAALRRKFTSGPILAVFDREGREVGTLTGSPSVAEVLTLLAGVDLGEGPGDQRNHFVPIHQ